MKNPTAPQDSNTIRGWLITCAIAAGLLGMMFLGKNDTPSTPASVTAEAQSPTVDDTTTCSWVTKAFDDEDKQKVAAAAFYIDKVLRSEERRVRSHVLARMSADGYGSTRAAVISWCRQYHPKTLREAAISMYDGLRGMNRDLTGTE